MPKLQFVPWQTEVDPGFWISLANLKIKVDKLDESTRQIIGMYDMRYGAPPAASCRVMINQSALQSNRVNVRSAFRCEGSIKNFNTMQAFLETNKNEAITKAGRQIWDAILDGTIYSIPSMLSSFLILSYADLKRHHFTSWFAFPAIHSDWDLTGDIRRPFTADESTQLVDEVGTWKISQKDDRQHGFFLAKKVRTSKQDADPSDLSDTPVTDIGYNWKIGSLGDFDAGFFDGVSPEDQYVSFVDPSTYAESPAWPIRNLLLLVRYRYKLRSVQIMCYRDFHARRHEARSIVIDFKVPEGDESIPDPALVPNPEMPSVTGWMRTNGSLKAIKTDLAAYMDPRNLADQSVDLNNSLMKWRIAENLDLDIIKGTKCLLLGAGTLGSYVSRNLLGWGVRKVTFVDNGRVSYSNPVRQPLFTFTDCQKGGAVKAERAAEALKEIYPGVTSTGHKLSVPMLGHPMINEAETKSDYDALKKLIDEHDVVFLLMDTRESRWLPTVMCKAAGKLVLNAALGFDTFVVMRHGVTPIDGGEAALGCYYCNDVVAPENSTKDVTLDQQCTVTRPGVAAIASALAVELMVSVLQHPLGALAPAPKMSVQQSPNSVSYDRDPPDHALGLVPHQIRGFLANYQNMLIKGQSYDCCSACSPKIVDAYKNDGFNFVKKALEQSDYVEELSGLAEVKRKAMEADVQEWSSEEDDEAVLL